MSMRPSFTALTRASRSDVALIAGLKIELQRRANTQLIDEAAEVGEAFKNSNIAVDIEMSISEALTPYDLGKLKQDIQFHQKLDDNLKTVLLTKCNARLREMGA